MGDSWERLLPVGSQPKLSLLTLGSFHCHPTTKGWFGPCARSGFQGSQCRTLSKGFGDPRLRLCQIAKFQFNFFEGSFRDRASIVRFLKQVGSKRGREN
jgi:hypothetical protein